MSSEYTANYEAVRELMNQNSSTRNSAASLKRMLSACQTLAITDVETHCLLSRFEYGHWEPGKPRFKFYKNYEEIVAKQWPKLFKKTLAETHKAME